jgi:predicted DCC family thiol-disulfide oxidoreductase YuxK
MTNNNIQFRVFYDGECPLCSREMAWLMRRIPQGTIDFVDISNLEFDASRYERSQKDFMAQIHGQKADGEMVQGMEVFRELYRHAGLGWLIAPTAWPLVKPLCDLAYSLFAKNRPRLTNRPRK